MKSSMYSAKRKPDLFRAFSAGVIATQL